MLSLWAALVSAFHWLRFWKAATPAQAALSAFGFESGLAQAGPDQQAHSHFVLSTANENTRSIQNIIMEETRT